MHGHMPPVLRSLAPCGTANSEAQLDLAARSSPSSPSSHPERFASEAPPAAGSRAGARTRGGGGMRPQDETKRHSDSSRNSKLPDLTHQVSKV